MPPIPSWLRFGRRIEYLRVFWRVFGGYLFREARSRKSIEALNGEEAVQSAFRHVLLVRWARVTKRRFVSSARF
jgi:hypothetical protein